MARAKRTPLLKPWKHHWWPNGGTPCTAGHWVGSTLSINRAPWYGTHYCKRSPMEWSPCDWSKQLRGGKTKTGQVRSMLHRWQPSRRLCWLAFPHSWWQGGNTDTWVTWWHVFSLPRRILCNDSPISRLISLFVPFFFVAMRPVSWGSVSEHFALRLRDNGSHLLWLCDDRVLAGLMLTIMITIMGIIWVSGWLLTIFYDDILSISCKCNNNFDNTFWTMPT